MDLQKRYTNLFGTSPHANANFELLMKKYSESIRSFYNLKLLQSQLEELDSVQEHIERLGYTKAALWYLYSEQGYLQDEITNKKQSAILAQEQGSMYRGINVVKNLILAVAHNTPQDNDSKYLIDITNSHLGKEEYIFNQIEVDLRKEINLDGARIDKRNNFLKQLVNSEEIYYTKEFKDKYELQARENIKTYYTKISTPELITNVM